MKHIDKALHMVNSGIVSPEDKLIISVQGEISNPYDIFWVCDLYYSNVLPKATLIWTELNKEWILLLDYLGERKPRTRTKLPEVLPDSPDTIGKKLQKHPSSHR